MTRKNYKMAAELIQSLKTEEREKVVKFLLVYFKIDNYAFKEDLFLKACGYGLIKKGR